MNIDTKRRAVYTVLSDVLEGDDLWDVMWRWETGYSQKSQYELNSFFSDCSDLSAIAGRRSQLYRELIGLLIKGTGELKPDPLSEMEAYRERLGLPSEPVFQLTSEWMPCFQVVIQEMMAGLSVDQLQKVRTQVEERAQRGRLAAELIYVFSMVASGKQYDDQLMAEFEDIKALVNLAYVALCEQQGPVLSDRQLAKGIERAQQEIQGVDPRLLLQHRRV
ncbi:MAG: hypothetical protein CMI09_05900 [Oceanospirillaceae bacterium]|nr:hypothetical protein [Oceanospirillaceae bacterium]|tara:strand:+ start:242 stop:901 length:660 start_codon:yes stop_codon:yes gene_type:complete